MPESYSNTQNPSKSNRMIQIVILVNQTFNFVSFLGIFSVYFVNYDRKTGTVA